MKRPHQHSFRSQQGNGTVLFALLILFVGGSALALLNRQTQLNAKLHVRANVHSMMKVLTRSAIETIDQILSAVDATGQPYFLVDEVQGALVVHRPLPPYIDSIYDEVTKTFSFEHCDVRAEAFRQEKYKLDSDLGSFTGCNSNILTSLRIDDVDASTVTVLALSSTDRKGLENMKYKIGARLIRQRCDLTDPADPTKLNPAYIFEDKTYSCHGKNIRVKLDRFRDSAVYDAVADTISFEYWIYHEENADHNCSSYRWDQKHSAYPGYVGNVDSWPNVGYTGADQHMKNVPGFVKGKWIWDGGWNRKREVTIHNISTGNLCSVNIQVKSGQPVGKRNGGCFAKGTLMTLADGRTVAIEDLSMGMRLLNPVSGQSSVVHSIVAGPEPYDMHRIHVDDHSVLVTREHPFLTDKGLTQAQDIRSGDSVFCESRGFCAVTKNEIIPSGPETTVYNVLTSYGQEELEKHYVVADGVATGDLYLQQWLEHQSKQTPATGDPLTKLIDTE